MAINIIKKQYTPQDDEGNYVSMLPDYVVDSANSIAAPYTGLIFFDKSDSKIKAISELDEDGETINSLYKTISAEDASSLIANAITNNNKSISGTYLKSSDYKDRYQTPLFTTGLKISTGEGGVSALYVPTGTTSTTVAAGNHTHSTYMVTNDNNVCTGTITASAFYESSDERYKTNIKNINDATNIPEVKEFFWKDSGKKSYGFIAQELEENYPELVNTKDDGFKAVNYDAALALVVGKLLNKVKSLETRIAELEKKN